MISISGFDDFSIVQEILKSLPTDESDKIYNTILRDAGKIAQTAMQLEANNSEGSSANGAIIIEKDKEHPNAFNIGVNQKKFFHYRFLIYGTEDRFTDAGIFKGKITANNNFILKALDQSIPDILKYFKENFLIEVDRLISKRSKSIGRKIKKAGK